MTIRDAKSNAYFALSDFLNSRAEGEHLLALARRAEDRVKEGAALAAMGFASMWAHDFERALAESREAIEVADPIGAAPVIAASRFTTGFVYAVTERLDAAKDEAWGRPVDVLVMPDGALLVSDDTGNAIYRISYRGR